VALGEAWVNLHADTDPFERETVVGVEKAVAEAQALAKDIQVHVNIDSDAFKRTAARLATTVGQEIGPAMSKGLSSSFSSFSIFSPALIVGAFVAALPAILLALGGAINLLGVGIVVALGAALASNAEIVQRQAKALGFEFNRSFKQAAVDALAVPIAEALGLVRQTLGQLQPQFQAIFQSVAGYIRPLTEGLLGLISNMLPGLLNMLQKSGPLIRVIADALPEMGRAFTSLFNAIADNADEIAKFFENLFAYINVGIRVLGFMVRAAAEVQDQMGRDIVVVRGLTDQFGKLTPTTVAATTAVANLSSAIERALNIIMSSQRADISWEASIDAVTASVKQNGISLDINTAKGRANKTALLDAVAAAGRMRDAAIASGKGTDVANAAYQKAIERLISIATKAGLSASALKKLAGDYEVNVTTHYYTTGARQQGTAYAEGTTWAKKGWALVGEQGPEFVKMRGGETVFNNTDSRRMFMKARGGNETKIDVGGVHLHFSGAITEQQARSAGSAAGQALMDQIALRDTTLTYRMA
jgi:hypothetical protein